MIKNLLKKVHYATIGNLRRFHYKHLRKKLKNTSPTIISSDCFGGVVYHNLGLKFNSPTINLFFEKKDFIVFVQNLSSFLQSELKEVKNETVNYPIGKLECNGNSVQINFMHYKTFDEAKEKWDERKKRVDYSNIYVIQTIASGVTEEDIVNFNNLPYKNKMLITSKNLINSKNVITLKVFEKNYYPGKILEYKSLFSLKKYMDDINYVNFLNEGKL